jgi:hypothetical protein
VRVLQTRRLVTQKIHNLQYNQASKILAESTMAKSDLSSEEIRELTTDRGQHYIVYYNRKASVLEEH